MEPYVTGAVIRRLREEKGLTQLQLGERIGVIDKTVSKWETGKGLPDITLLEPLAAALGVSLMELLSGAKLTNRNVSGNVLRTRFFVCPVCGNVLTGLGDAAVSCCGVPLPPLTAEEAEGEHIIQAQRVEDEWFLTIPHPMTKEHFISFAAFVSSDRMQMIKLYPEGDPQFRMDLRGGGMLYLCCNHHGLFRQKVSRMTATEKGR